MLSAARESIAVSSGSDSGNATLPDGGSAAESSSPEPSSSPDAVIDNPSSAGAPNEMLGPALSEDPAYSSGNPRRCDVLEEWEARGGVLHGEALTVILSSPWPWAEVVLRPEELERGRARGIPPRLARRYLERNIAMVMFPQWEHDSSTSAASACLKPKHEGQRSWPSDEVRKRPHPETHEREAIFKKTPVTRGALLDCSFCEKVSLLGALKRRGEVAAWPSFSLKESALDSDLRWRAVTPTLACLADTLETAMARLRSEKLMCVCTRSPFIPAPRGGVRVTKHARQLSLACFVNTRRWLGSPARSH